jgi:hypothetical protein
MKTLVQLCIDNLINNHKGYIGPLLSHDLYQMIKENEIRYNCNDLVTRMIKMETSYEQNPFVGYEHGIQSVIQSKLYVRNVQKICEERTKKGTYNVGYFLSPLVFYYMLQEDDIFTWFDGIKYINIHGTPNPNNILMKTIYLMIDAHWK